MKVYISPSTQQHNTTALGDTEENVMHKIADELVPLLKDSGIEVFRGRKEQTLTEMVKESDSKAVDIHVAIHSNATSTVGDNPRGCEVFYYFNSKKGKLLAEILYKHLEVLTPTKDRGVIPNSTFYELKKTKAPAVLIEVDFHDNVDGAKWIMDNIYPIAETIAKGICEYFNIPLKKNPYRQAVEQIKKILEGL